MVNGFIYSIAQLNIFSLNFWPFVFFFCVLWYPLPILSLLWFVSALHIWGYLCHIQVFFMPGLYLLIVSWQKLYIFSIQMYLSSLLQLLLLYLHLSPWQPVFSSRSLWFKSWNGLLTYIYHMLYLIYYIWKVYQSYIDLGHLITISLTFIPRCLHEVCFQT